MERKRNFLLAAIMAIIVIVILVCWLQALEQGSEFMNDWETVNGGLEDVWKNPGETAVQFPVPINTATVPELETLPQIGPAKARAIVDYRNEHGPFKTLEDLLNVKGIGEKTLAAIKDKITLEEK